MGEADGGGQSGCSILRGQLHEDRQVGLWGGGGRRAQGRPPWEMPVKEGLSGQRDQLVQRPMREK